MLVGTVSAPWAFADDSLPPDLFLVRFRPFAFYRHGRHTPKNTYRVTVYRLSMFAQRQHGVEPVTECLFPAPVRPASVFIRWQGQGSGIPPWSRILPPWSRIFNFVSETLVILFQILLLLPYFLELLLLLSLLPVVFVALHHFIVKI